MGYLCPFFQATPPLLAKSGEMVSCMLQMSLYLWNTLCTKHLCNRFITLVFIFVKSFIYMYFGHKFRYRLESEPSGPSGRNISSFISMERLGVVLLPLPPPPPLPLVREVSKKPGMNRVKCHRCLLWSFFVSMDIYHREFTSGNVGDAHKMQFDMWIG